MYEGSSPITGLLGTLKYKAGGTGLSGRGYILDICFNLIMPNRQKLGLFLIIQERKYSSNKTNCFLFCFQSCNIP